MEETKVQIKKKLEEQLPRAFRSESELARLTTQLIDHVKNKSAGHIEGVVDVVKKALKGKESSTIKFNALKLLKDVLDTRNKELSIYVEKKILKRLKDIAKLTIKDPKDRKNFFTSDVKADEFFQLLLECFQNWQYYFQIKPDTQREPSAYKKAASELREAGVKLPASQFTYFNVNVSESPNVKPKPKPKPQEEPKKQSKKQEAKSSDPSEKFKDQHNSFQNFFKLVLDAFEQDDASSLKDLQTDLQTLVQMIDDRFINELFMLNIPEAEDLMEDIFNLKDTSNELIQAIENLAQGKQTYNGLRKMFQPRIQKGLQELKYQAEKKQAPAQNPAQQASKFQESQQAANVKPSEDFNPFEFKTVANLEPYHMPTVPQVAAEPEPSRHIPRNHEVDQKAVAQGPGVQTSQEPAPEQWSQNLWGNNQFTNTWDAKPEQPRQKTEESVPEWKGKEQGTTEWTGQGQGPSEWGAKQPGEQGQGEWMEKEQVDTQPEPAPWNLNQWEQQPDNLNNAWGQQAIQDRWGENSPKEDPKGNQFGQKFEERFNANNEEKAEKIAVENTHLPTNQYGSEFSNQFQDARQSHAGHIEAHTAWERGMQEEKLQAQGQENKRKNMNPFKSSLYVEDGVENIKATESFTKEQPEIPEWNRDFQEIPNPMDNNQSAFNNMSKFFGNQSEMFKTQFDSKAGTFFGQTGNPMDSDLNAESIDNQSDYKGHNIFELQPNQQVVSELDIKSPIDRSNSQSDRRSQFYPSQRTGHGNQDFIQTNQLNQVLQAKSSDDDIEKTRSIFPNFEDPRLAIKPLNKGKRRPQLGTYFFENVHYLPRQATHEKRNFSVQVDINLGQAYKLNPEQEKMHQKQRIELQSANSQLKDEKSGLLQQVDELKAENQQQQKEIAYLMQYSRKLKEAQKQVSEQNAQIYESYLSLKNANSKLEQELQELKQENFTLSEDLTNQIRQNADVKLQNDSLENRFKQLESMFKTVKLDHKCQVITYVQSALKRQTAHIGQSIDSQQSLRPSRLTLGPAKPARETIVYDPNLFVELLNTCAQPFSGTIDDLKFSILKDRAILYDDRQLQIGVITTLSEQTGEEKKLRDQLSVQLHLINKGQQDLNISKIKLLAPANTLKNNPQISDNSVLAKRKAFQINLRFGYTNWLKLPQIEFEANSQVHTMMLPVTPNKFMVFEDCDPLGIKESWNQNKGKQLIMSAMLESLNPKFFKGLSDLKKYFPKIVSVHGSEMMEASVEGRFKIYFKFKMKQEKLILKMLVDEALRYEMEQICQFLLFLITK